MFCSSVGENRHEEREFNIEKQIVISRQTSRIAAISTRANQTFIRQIHAGPTRTAEYLQGD